MERPVNMKNDRWIMLCCGGILLCVCAALWVPYTEWGILFFSILCSLRLYFADTAVTGLAKAHPKNRTVREMAVLSIFFISINVVIILLRELGWLSAELKEELQFFMLLFLVLVYGNAAPKLPFNRHLGLRLPWTTADENTWRYAHRICGYMSFPTAFAMLCAYAADSPSVIAGALCIGFVVLPAGASYQYYQKQKKDRI